MTDTDRLIAVLRPAITTAEAHQRGLVELSEELKEAGAGVMPAFAAWDAVNAAEALVNSLRHRLEEVEEQQREDEQIDASLRENGIGPGEIDDEDEQEGACDGRHPLITHDGSTINPYDLVTHPGCPHQPWARPEGANQVDCPARCPSRDREHLHIEHADGYGEVVGLSGELIEPWDLIRPANIIAPRPPRGAIYPPCYAASFGPVHSQPSCRCSR